ncbi:MAG TPA: helix-turn-helix domain-containing protein [Acidimicrobiales bacterium]|nr:helix-turn-helix domain-containing protein [Acidimicrobiales bacterium]
MQRLPRRKQTRTKAALVRAALQLFAEKGYAATTVGEIAHLAEVTERTFFLHFPSKEDVLFGVDEEDLRVLEQCIVDEPAARDTYTVLERAILAWHATKGGDEERHRMSQLLVRAAQSSPTLRGRQLDYSEALARSAARALARRKGRAEPDEADETAADIAIRVLYLAIVDWTQARAEDLEALVKKRFVLMRAGSSPRRPG